MSRTYFLQFSSYEKSLALKFVSVYVFLLLIALLHIIYTPNQIQYKISLPIIIIVCFLLSVGSLSLREIYRNIFLLAAFFALLIFFDIMLFEKLEEQKKNEYCVYFVAIYFIIFSESMKIFSAISFIFLILYTNLKTLNTRGSTSMICAAFLILLQIIILFLQKKKEKNDKKCCKNYIEFLNNIFNNIFPGMVFRFEKENEFNLKFINKKAQNEYNIYNFNNFTNFLKEIIYYKEFKNTKEEIILNNETNEKFKDDLINNINSDFKTRKEFRICKKENEKVLHDLENGIFHNIDFLCYHKTKQMKLKVFMTTFDMFGTTQKIIFITHLHEDDYLEFKKMDEKKDKLLVSITHDLRTPLNGVMAFISLSKAEQEIEKRNKYLEMAHINSKLLMALIEDILDFQCIANNKFNLKLEEFKLNEIIEEINELFSMQTREKNIAFIIGKNFGESDKITLFTDSRRLKQILYNLISNSIKFTSNGGQIKLNVFLTNHSNILKFEIIDTGIGIKPEIIKNLFQPFGTFDTNGLNKYGIGFGLYLCKNISLQIGPKEQNFHLSSIYGQGTKVGFLIYKKLNIQESETLSFKKQFFQNSQSYESEKTQKANSLYSKSESRTELWKKNLLLKKQSSVYVQDLERKISSLNMNESLWNKMQKSQIYEYQNSPIKKANTLKLSKKKGVESNSLDSVKNELFVISENCSFRNFSKNEIYFDYNLTEIQEEESPQENKNNLPQYLMQPKNMKSLFGKKNRNIKFTGESYFNLMQTKKDQIEEFAINSIDNLHIYKRNIVIADDNLFNVIVLQEYLMKIYEFELNIIKVCDGSECLKLFESLNKSKNNQNIDIIFMDCIMPLMDGYTATKEIKRLVSEENYTDCFVIAITGQSGLEEEIKCKNHGMDDFITKPVTEKEFREMFLFYMNE